jgi:hypothetical protein
MKNLKDFLSQISRNNGKSHVFGENKAIFVTGGPGSGKDVIIREVLEHVDITEVNHMQAYNYLADKKKLFEKSNDFRRETIRNHYPIIINAPADDMERISYIKEELEELGYNTLMVFVNTTDQVSRERNEKLTRMMFETVRHGRWVSSQSNKTTYRELFENFTQLNNNSSIEHIEDDIVLTYRKINKFLVSESTQPRMIKMGQSKADGPSDITPDNRAGVSQHGDDVKSDTPARKNPNKTYIFKTYSEAKDQKMIVAPEPKVTNFSKDKDIVNKKKKGDSSISASKIGNPPGIGGEYDTRAGGQGAAAGAGLGNQTYSESQDFSNAQPSSAALPGSSSLQPNPLSNAYDNKKTFSKFKKSLKEYNGFQNDVDMGVGGVLGGATNKEPMQSYNDQDKKIGIKITKKGKKNV